MITKSKLHQIQKIILESSLFIFVITALIFVLNYLKIINTSIILDQKISLITFVVSGTLIIIGLRTDKINFIWKYIFILLLLFKVSTIARVGFINNITSYTFQFNLYLDLCLVSFAAISYFKSQDKSIDHLRFADLRLEQEKSSRFVNRLLQNNTYLKISQIIRINTSDYFITKLLKYSILPIKIIVSNISKVMKQILIEGWPNILILLLIFAIALFNNHSHFSDPLLDNINSEKYVSYIPTAEQIVRNKDPFYFSNPSYTYFNESIGTQHFENYWELPFFYWYLALFLLLKGYLSVETAIHSAMFLLGLIILYLVYRLFTCFFNKYFALFATYIFSLTPMFIVLSRLTTMDTPALILFLISILFYREGNSKMCLTFLSLSILTKLSFGIIGLMFFTTLFMFEKEYYLIIKMLMHIGVSFISFKIFVSRIPLFTELILVQLLMIILFIMSILIINRLLWRIKENTLVSFVKLHPYKVFSLFIFLLLISISFWFRNIANLIPEFLTSTKLIININFYKILWIRILEMNSNIINSFIVLCIISIIILFRNKYFVALLVSSIAYFLIASKSIRYALYYNHIFVILLTILVLYLIYFNLSLLRNNFLITIVIIILLLIAQTNFNRDNNIVFKQHPIFLYSPDLINFIDKNTTKDSKVLITQTEFNSIYNYIPRAYILINGIKDTPYEKRLTNLKEAIRAKGFYKLMKEYNVTYLIMNSQEIDFSNLLYLFDPDVNEDTFMRDNLIMKSLGDVPQGILQTNNNTKVDYDPSKYFKPVFKKGRYTVFQLIDPDDHLSEE